MKLIYKKCINKFKKAILGNYRALFTEFNAKKPNVQNIDFERKRSEIETVYISRREDKILPFTFQKLY